MKQYVVHQNLTSFNLDAERQRGNWTRLSKAVKKNVKIKLQLVNQLIVNIVAEMERLAQDKSRVTSRPQDCMRISQSLLATALQTLSMSTISDLRFRCKTIFYDLHSRCLLLLHLDGLA